MSGFIMSLDARDRTREPPRVSSPEPTSSAREAAASMVTETASAVRAGPRRVLLVEDNPGDADLVRLALEDASADWQVEHVSRLSDCLAALDANGANVVLLDLSLPDASGLEGVIELARARPDVPVVVLTGMSDEEVGAKAVQQGAQEYLLKKELESRTLRRVLRYAVERQALAREKASRAASAEALRRVTLLADASIAVASTLDERELAARLTRVLVPRLGSFCAVEWLRADGRARCVGATVGADLVLHDLDLEASEREAAQLRSRSSRGAQLGTALGDPLPSWGETWKRESESLGICSMVVLPLEIRGEPLGTLTLGSAQAYASADVVLGEVIARRMCAGFETARLYEQALEAVRVRDDFISMASHELRTPLTSLLLDAQRLSLGSTDDRDKLRRASGRITRSSERLARLIGDLLDVSRIRAGRFVVELAEVDFRGVVADALDRYAPQLARAGSTVALESGPGIVGRWDRSRLHQVVANLLQNAIRYGEGKPIEIGLSADERRARLSVKDHGCGMAPEQLERLFEQFARPTTSSSREGLGLGLWIARGIVEAHGGTIWARSVVGEGSEFVVELPREGPKKPDTGAMR